MERRRLGQLEVSAVGLGCGTMTPFYGEPDRAAGIATIRRAREIGVDLLDTADGYGRGRNEELVAEAVRGHRGDYIIASKFGNLGLLGDPRFADGRPEYVHEACEKSLGRLRTDVIDLYYIHRVDPTVPIEDTIGAMSKLVHEGKVRFLGICEAGAATIRRAHAVHPLAAVQIEYSHGPQLGLARPTQTLYCRHVGLNQRPFRIRDIACVALSLSLILAPSDFGPHLVPR